MHTIFDKKKKKQMKKKKRSKCSMNNKISNRKLLKATRFWVKNRKKTYAQIIIIST
jgi:hypothetical protein